ncbi:hypothetical protein GE061_002720 [Apolygus lucorum]|uniref:Uncharacterized protein n=1 Tax=Apolygus lucorum TaxID=248454 RepID=A0A8S9X798_APOLU|nr:hypothetical protein GE061_002720 [Apolygus lucorum]
MSRIAVSEALMTQLEDVLHDTDAINSTHRRDQPLAPAFSAPPAQPVERGWLQERSDWSRARKKPNPLAAAGRSGPIVPLRGTWEDRLSEE